MLTTCDAKRHRDMCLSILLLRILVGNVFAFECYVTCYRSCETMYAKSHYPQYGCINTIHVRHVTIMVICFRFIWKRVKVTGLLYREYFLHDKSCRSGTIYIPVGHSPFERRCELVIEENFPHMALSKMQFVMSLMLLTAVR